MKTIRNHIGPPTLSAVFLVLAVVIVASAALSSSTQAQTGTVSETGSNTIDHFVANLYNHHRILFAILVTASMAIVGLGISRLIELLIPAAGRRPRR